MGVGLGGLSLPHYRGSDQSASYISPIPYLRYNGKKLKVDREGGRYNFYDDKDIRVDISLAFAIAVDSDDNYARKGMVDLANVIEVGPRIQFKLYQSEDKNLRLRLAVPLRTALATNFTKTESIGLVFSPYLQLRYFKAGWESAFSIGPSWASEEYHDYFYEVKPQYATATRSAYDAKSGYSGSRLTFSLSKRFNKIYFGLFSRYDYLKGATFMNSPLVKKDDSLTLGVALSWVFIKSKE
jgi:outer membrane scaffolding protein for murein synthesis (MipA/OmpV family)